MESPRKYKVVTFRGWSYQPDYPSAIREAYRLIEEIKADGRYSSDLHWARIEYTYCIDRVRAFVYEKDGKKVVQLCDRPANKNT